MAHQIIIEVEDNGILPSLRKVLNCIKGVSVVRQTDTDKPDPSLSAYEESVEDIQKGRMTTYDSAEEFFEKMGI